jgi:hypothetical protein
MRMSLDGSERYIVAYDLTDTHTYLYTNILGEVVPMPEPPDQTHTLEKLIDEIGSEAALAIYTMQQSVENYNHWDDDRVMAPFTLEQWRRLKYHSWYRKQVCDEQDKKG